MDLSGTWRAAPAQQATLRPFSSDDLDDRDWLPVPVPGRWTDVEAWAEAPPDVVRYRRRFAHPPATATTSSATGTGTGTGDRLWLVFHGLTYQADVWLNDSYLGDAEGYFMTHQFDATAAMAGRDEHILAVELSCPRRTAGPSQGGHLLGTTAMASELVPPGNGGGVHAPVRLQRTGPVRILDLHVGCATADADSAQLVVHAVLDAATAGPVRLRTTVGDTEHEGDHVLAAGHNHITWSVQVAAPRLWWPHRLGDQPLYPVAVEVAEAAPDAPVSDHRELRTGLRTVRMQGWQFSVNGERMFLKGSSFAPTGDEDDRLRADVALAADAGLDLVRVYGHVAPPALYDAADEAGVLLWQDMPLVGPLPKPQRHQAVQHAQALVHTVGSHPSVVLWCGHVDPVGDSAAWQGTGRPTLWDRLAEHQRPNWNMSVLDRSIKRELERCDRTRPVVAYSGVLPHLPRLDGTDTHLWLGWYQGNERDLQRLAARWPRAVRFVSQFGSQSLPVDTTFVDPHGTWPQVDWATLASHHGLDAAAMRRYVPPEAHPTLADWQQATQAYQAMLVRRHIETLRRLKYRPAGGFCQHFFADGHPVISSSLLDWQRQPKQAYEALRLACRPVIVVADRLPAALTAGERVRLAVHLVSDLRHPLRDVRVDATLVWPDGEQAWSWGGEVGADECVRVGTLEWTASDTPGPVTLHLQASGEAIASNRYDSTITPAP